MNRAKQGANDGCQIRLALFLINMATSATSLAELVGEPAFPHLGFAQF